MIQIGAREVGSSITSTGQADCRNHRNRHSLDLTYRSREYFDPFHDPLQLSGWIEARVAVCEGPGAATEAWVDQQTLERRTDLVGPGGDHPPGDQELLQVERNGKAG